MNKNTAHDAPLAPSDSILAAVLERGIPRENAYAFAFGAVLPMLTDEQVEFVLRVIRKNAN